MATKNKDIGYYMGLPYTAEVKHDEDGWFARVVELPGCMTWADSFEELGPMIEDAKRGWIEDALEHGDPVPEPKNTGDYSGKVNLRMPKSLHRDLARAALVEGVSLNQLMVANLARSMGAPKPGRGTWENIAAEALGVAPENIKVDYLQSLETTGDAASASSAADDVIVRVKVFAEEAVQATENVADQTAEQAADQASE